MQNGENEYRKAIEQERETHTARLARIQSEIDAGTYETPARVAATVDRIIEREIVRSPFSTDDDRDQT